MQARRTSAWRGDYEVWDGDRSVPTFDRSSWRGGGVLHVDGQPTGSIKRTSTWKGDAVADLPGLPPLVALFALAVVLTTWDLAAAAS